MASSEEVFRVPEELFSSALAQKTSTESPGQQTPAGRGLAWTPPLPAPSSEEAISKGHWILDLQICHLFRTTRGPTVQYYSGTGFGRGHWNLLFRVDPFRVCSQNLPQTRTLSNPSTYTFEQFRLCAYGLVMGNGIILRINSTFSWKYILNIC